MEVKGVNPFLFNDDDYLSSHSEHETFTDTESVNPFLTSENDEFSAAASSTGSDNPFLFENKFNNSSNATNPFAFDSASFEAPAVSDNSQLLSNNFFTRPEAETEDFFSLNQEDNIVSNVPPQKPTDLDLKYTNTTSQAPSRPPPPRPPPSKETQDLLMSVMGAMDATSSHLLDRIPPTRTPSPVSMRDLHSPSPTPEHQFGDLLDVGNGPKAAENNSIDLMSLNQDNPCDINQNPPQTELVTAVNNKPARPSRPPRPKLPQQIQEQQPPLSTVPKPAPPIIPRAQDEMMDMFGIAEATVPKVATKADILNLYNAKPESRPTDLLFDNVEPEESSKIQREHIATENSPSSVSLQEPQNIQDNFISPEPSQNDLQMDTSDSQSKGSVSSVTFNPFAGTEDLPITQEVSPMKPIETSLDNNIFLQNQQIELFGQTEDDTIKISKNTGDEFDAFAQKFESVKDENKNGGFNAVFGPVNDAWGNDFGETQDTSTGFEAEESFDAFLALQEPPTVPQSTPNRMSKNESQDSDEDKDFSVFIKYYQKLSVNYY